MLHPRALGLARRGRAVVTQCVENDVADDIDRALDLYARTLTDVFGLGWRRRVGPGYRMHLATRLQQGY